jgi:hypothetical protein
MGLLMSLFRSLPPHAMTVDAGISPALHFGH